MDTLALSFYGVGVTVRGPAEVVDRLRRDFRRFEGGGDDVVVDATLGPVDPRASRLHVPRRTGPVWDEGDVRQVRWHAGASVTWDYRTERGEARATTPELLHEVLYLLILSRVGELHDRRGIHRLHAMGLNVGGRAVLVVLPSGTGKSTLAFGALQAGLGTLMADDMVLVDGDRILPFPSRLGSVEPPAVDAAYVARFPRMQHGLKYVVDVDAFGDRVGGPAVPPGMVIVGHRGRGASRIVEVPGAVVAPELTRSMVVGIGLPQVLEFFVRADLRPKLTLLRSRARAARRLIVASRTYYWRLGDDRAENLRVLERVCG